MFPSPNWTLGIEIFRFRHFALVNIHPFSQGFGDLALINDSPRLATIITSDPCELAVVEKVCEKARSTCLLLIEGNVHIVYFSSCKADYNRIIKFIHEKEAKEKMLFLRKISIFQDWSVASLRSVGQKMEWKKFLPGQVIIAEGMACFC